MNNITKEVKHIIVEGEMLKLSRKMCCFSAISLILLTCYSCEKMVEAGPPTTSVNEINVFSDEGTAISVLTGIYASMSKVGTFSGNQGVSFFAGLSADELSLWAGVSDNTQLSVYQNKQTINSNPSNQLWGSLYKYIFQCNAAIAGLDNSKTLTPVVKQQLLGEAKFCRAFFYFYLVNLYGDIPLAISSDYTVNSGLFKTPKEKIFEQIISDLKEAKVLLNEKYLDGNLKPYTGAVERVRPSKWAATALLARVYLYTRDWSSAESESTEIIANSSLFSLNTLSNAFLKASLGNNEAIWQLQPVNIGWNTEDGRLFVINAALSNSKPVHISRFLLKAFETNDSRATTWVKDTLIGATVYFYPYKYRSAKLNNPVSEYLMLIRLAEQFLIRAEAKAQLGKVGDALGDLNVIRSRAKLPLITTGDKVSVLEAIMHERQVELFSELGSRWFDLKRTDRIDAVMNDVTPFKSVGGKWETYQKLYPLPTYDIEKNQNLIQNFGY